MTAGKGTKEIGGALGTRETGDYIARVPACGIQSIEGHEVMRRTRMTQDDR